MVLAADPTFSPRLVCCCYFSINSAPRENANWENEKSAVIKGYSPDLH
jgi:hypothetical protein